MAPARRSPSINLSMMPSFQSFFRRDRIAVGAHFHRGGDARKSGQTLRSSRARNDAELHFGLADLRRRNGDAIVAGHREFQAAAKRGAVNRNDDRLSTVFDTQKKRQQFRRRAAPCRKSSCRIP